jgi:uncharacterized protein YqgV (UPF0045/DUF77 family)
VSKTIKQIADELGVSKQAVHQKRRKEPLSTSLQPFTTTVDGVIYISVDGENLIKQAFSDIDRKQVDGSFTPSFTSVDGSSGELSGVIEILKKQLEVKDKQIEQQQQSIKELTAALENTTTSLKAAQALHAGTMQQHFESLPPISGEPPERQADPVEPQERKESFFSRFFGKGK